MNTFSLVIGHLYTVEDGPMALVMTPDSWILLREALPRGSRMSKMQ